MRKEVRLINGTPTLCEIGNDGKIIKVLSTIKKVVHTEEETELQKQYYAKRDKIEQDKIERAKIEQDNFNRVDSKIGREHKFELEEVEKRQEVEKLIKEEEELIEKDKVVCRYCAKKFKIQSIYRHEAQCNGKRKMLTQRALLGTPLKISVPVRVEHNKEGDNLTAQEPKELKIVKQEEGSNKDIAVGIKEIEKTKNDIDKKENKLDELKEDKDLSKKELVELEKLKKEILDLKKELNEQTKELNEKLDKTDVNVKNVNERIDMQGKKMKRGIVEIFGRKW